MFMIMMMMMMMICGVSWKDDQYTNCLVLPHETKQNLGF